MSCVRSNRGQKDVSQSPQYANFPQALPQSTLARLDVTSKHLLPPSTLSYRSHLRPPTSDLSPPAPRLQVHAPAFYFSRSISVLHPNPYIRTRWFVHTLLWQAVLPPRVDLTAALRPVMPSPQSAIVTADGVVTAPVLRLPVLLVLGVALRLAVLWLGVDALSERVEWSVGRSRLKQRRLPLHHMPAAAAGGRSSTSGCSKLSPPPLGRCVLCSPGVLVLVERSGPMAGRFPLYCEPLPFVVVVRVGWPQRLLATAAAAVAAFLVRRLSAVCS